MLDKPYTTTTDSTEADADDKDSCAINDSLYTVFSSNFRQPDMSFAWAPIEKSGFCN